MQVILVGHDFGGACISYAMELFTSKVSKAIFIAATMLTDGQSALEIFSLQVCSCFLLHLLTYPTASTILIHPLFEVKTLTLSTRRVCVALIFLVRRTLMREEV